MAEEIVGLGKLERRLDAMTSRAARHKYMRKLGAATRDRARAKVMRRTGSTARHIRTTKVTSSSVKVASAGAGVFIEGGTVPHTIAAKRGKALAFASQGLTSARFGSKATLRTKKGGGLKGSSQKRFGNAAFLVVRKVKHPGLPAEPFLRPAAVEAIRHNTILEDVVAEWNGAA